MMSDLQLSIVIVNFNTRDLLAQCLLSILGSRESAVSNFQSPISNLQVLVVDNASQDDSAAMLRERFPQVQVIQNLDNVGFARANNQGIRASTGHYILLLNPDTEIQPDALNRLVAFLDAHPEAGAVGLQLLNPDGTLQPSGRRFPTLASAIGELLPLPKGLRARVRGDLERRDYRLVCEVDEVSGAAMCLRRTALDEIGLLDEAFFFLGEDIDLCWRLRKAGWKTFYLPDARVIHHWGSSRNTVAPFRISLLSQRAHYLLFRKHRSRIDAGALRVFVTALTILKMAKWSVLSIARGQLRQIVHAHIAELAWLWRN